MVQALRRGFDRDLADIDEKVVQLFALVTEGLAAATDSFLAGDRDTARAIVDRDRIVDDLYADIELLVQRQILLQAPVARDLRYLLSVLRIVPELERSGDLVEHIASRAARGIGRQLTPTIRGLVGEMGQRGGEMWRYAADAFAERDAEAAPRLEEMDDRLDDLHEQLATEIASGALVVGVAIEMGLVGRFYERLGDHAQHVSERVRYLVEGSAT